MKYFSISLIYIGFLSLIGFALYFTKNPHVLWALLLTPSIKFNETEKEKEND